MVEKKTANTFTTGKRRNIVDVVADMDALPSLFHNHSTNEMENAAGNIYT